MRMLAAVAALIVVGWLQTLWLRELVDWGETVIRTIASVNSILLWLLVANLQDDGGLIGKACRAICRPFKQEPE